MVTELRVIIADDHPVVRKGLSDIFSESFPGSTVVEATTAQMALDLAAEGSWDLVMLDITMPGRNGLDALRDFKRDHPGLPVLVLSMHDEKQYAVRVLKAGASGYLSKEAAPEKLADAVQQILSGGRFVSKAVAHELVEVLVKKGGDDPHTVLSDREFDVFLRLASGETVTAIAKALSLSVKTVSTYRTRIIEKTGLPSNAQMARYAIHHRLL
ncbi:MAG: response regulator transcription factor [Verrucomicrobia bacterium]|nr:response regulator transcription factor [Verrucomicrobiota bacterium]